MLYGTPSADVAAERERLNKELAKLTKAMDSATQQLSNPAYLAKAPEKVVNGLKQSKAEMEVVIAKLKAALVELS